MEENVQGSRQKYLKYKQKYIYKKNLVGGAPEILPTTSISIPISTPTETPTLDSFFEKLYLIINKIHIIDILNKHKEHFNPSNRVLKFYFAKEDIAIDTLQFILNLIILHQSLVKEHKDKNEEKMACTLILFIRLINRNAIAWDIFSILYNLAGADIFMKSKLIIICLIKDLEELYHEIISHKIILLPYLQKNKSQSKSRKTGFIDIKDTIIIEGNRKHFNFWELQLSFMNMKSIYNSMKDSNDKYHFTFNEINYTEIIDKIYKLVHEIDLIISGGFDILLNENGDINDKLEELISLSSTLDHSNNADFNKYATLFVKYCKSTLDQFSHIIIREDDLEITTSKHAHL